MSTFGNLTTAGMEDTQDRLGGFQVHESGAYTGTIKAAYAGSTPKSKAQSVTIILDTEAGEYRETFWVSNKVNENFYTKDGKKHLLPGFIIVNDTCLVTTDKELSQQVTEDKVMNVWDPESRKEQPTSVKMLVDLLGKTVTYGLLKQIVNKNEKDQATGEYVPTAETREENVTDKVFHHPTNLTIVEARQGIKEATFFDAWVKKNKGVDRDRRTIKDGAGGAQSGRAGRPAGAPKAGDTNGAGQARTSSLFGK